ncbi:MAG: sulfite exporter TauE/SafE family protein [Chloroflexaceae bacterium]
MKQQRQKTELVNVPTTSIRPHALRAFSYAVPIGALGGLIGLGGAEFRLPVLAGPLRYTAHQAVPLNLAVSLVTVTTALMTRGWTLSPATLRPFMVAIAALIAASVVTAFSGVALAGRLSQTQLERTILVLLVSIGTALMIEGVLPTTIPGLLPAHPIRHLGAGILAGLAIGLVSSLLGVAGGELIIPTLMFIFGADIKTAGTASLLISLPMVLVGVLRYARRGAFGERRDLVQTIAPMGVGSVIGAILGGVLAGIVPPALLKIGLGIILIVSALRIFHHTRARQH